MAPTTTARTATPRTTPATDRDVAIVRAVLRGHRAGRGLFLVDDPENVARALAGGVRVMTLFHTADTPPLAPDGTPFPVPHRHLATEVARQVFGDERASRVFAVARRPPPHRLAALSGRAGDVVVLDGVRLTGNIGAVVRSAVALGAAGVVLVDSGLTTTTDRRLVRASRGLVFTIPVVLATAAELVAFCGAEGIRLVVTDAAGDAPVQRLASVPGRLALVLGGERRGCSEELRRCAVGAVTIPTSPEVESLNVSVAAAIALFCRAGLGGTTVAGLSVDPVHRDRAPQPG